MLSEQSCRIIAGGFDWITATAKTDIRRRGLLRLAAGVAVMEEREGNEVKTWSWMGYSGTTCGQVAYGERPDSAIVRLSGNLARSNAVAVLAMAENISRLDLQVTFAAPLEERHLAVELFQVHGRLPERRGRPTASSIILNRPEGETCYIGSRKSEQLLRLYDKHAESPNEYGPGAWRIELELKGDAAFAASRAFLAASTGQRWVASYLVAWLRQRNLPVWFRHDDVIELPQPVRAPTDVERKLAWLAEQVAPSVEFLLAHTSERRVLDALGLRGRLVE